MCAAITSKKVSRGRERINLKNKKTDSSIRGAKKGVQYTVQLYHL